MPNSYAVREGWGARTHTVDTGLAYSLRAGRSPAAAAQEVGYRAGVGVRCGCLRIVHRMCTHVPSGGRRSLVHPLLVYTHQSSLTERKFGYRRR